MVVSDSSNIDRDVVFGNNLLTLNRERYHTHTDLNKTIYDRDNHPYARTFSCLYFSESKDNSALILVDNFHDIEKHDYSKYNNNDKTHYELLCKFISLYT